MWVGARFEALDSVIIAASKLIRYFLPFVKWKRLQVHHVCLVEGQQRSCTWSTWIHHIVKKQGLDGDKIQPNLEAACEHPHSQLQNELNFNFVLAITSKSYNNQLLDQVWIRLVIRKFLGDGTDLSSKKWFWSCEWGHSCWSPWFVLHFSSSKPCHLKNVLPSL